MHRDMKVNTIVTIHILNFTHWTIVKHYTSKISFIETYNMGIFFHGFSKLWNCS